jgi:hypothetical protein
MEIPSKVECKCGHEHAVVAIPGKGGPGVQTICVADKCLCVFYQPIASCTPCMNKDGENNGKCLCGCHYVNLRIKYLWMQ